MTYDTSGAMKKSDRIEQDGVQQQAQDGVPAQVQGGGGKMDLSFSGAGFMGCYYFGVVNCWNKYIPRERVNRVAGASAGSLIAAYYLMDLSLSECLKEIVEMTEDIRKRPLGVFDRSNQIVDLLPAALNKMFPDDAHKRVSGRLYVCMTRLKDMKKIVVNEFESKKDLIDALNCSCFIPVWSGNHVSTYKGVKHIDGGFTDNMPVFDEHTIRVCCFSGATDISPYDRVKMELLSGSFQGMPFYLNPGNCRRVRRALFPPPPSFIIDILERGFQDAKDFILTNDLIQCDKCYGSTDPRDQTIYSRITPTISPAATPSITPAASQLDLSQLGPVLGNHADHKRADSTPKQLQPSSNYLSAANVEGDESAPAGKRLSFKSLLRRKLNKAAESSNQNEEKQEESETTAAAAAAGERQPTKEAPTIVVAPAAEDGQAEAASEPSGEQAEQQQQQQQQQPEPEPGEEREAEAGQPDERAARKTGRRPSESGAKPAEENFFAIRRSTLAHVDTNQLLVDRFKLAPEPLPSCPPSPNLNRHCDECIRMRQEARMDLLDEAVMREAERYKDYKDPAKEFNSLRSRLAGPLRWLRQLGVKSSYTFQAAQPGQPIAPCAY